MKGNDRAATAYHEAGHAVAAWVLHLPFQYVTIRPDEDSKTLGHIRHHKSPTWLKPDIELTPKTRWRIECEVVSLFAGSIAERKYAGRRNNIGASSDYQMAFNLASYLYFSDKSLSLYLQLQQVSAEALIGQSWNWKAVQALAGALLKRERISSTEARKIMIEATDPTTGR